VIQPDEVIGMSSTTLDYVLPDTPRLRRRWPGRTLCLIGAALLIAIAAPTADVRQVESRMDVVTGSMTWKTVWLFGITSGPRVEVSPLETRLRSSGIQWTPSWQFLHNTHRNVLGHATCYECGSAPAIYGLRPVLEEFAAASTDAELREFVRVMQSGTDAEQRAAVEAAVEKGLQALSTAPPPNGVTLSP
jgi:hypothetical protein